MQEKGKLKFLLTFFGSIILIITVSLINQFPEGYIFSGSDTVQFFDLSRKITQLSFVWASSGVGMFLQHYGWVLFHLILYVFQLIFNLSASQLSSVYYLIYLFGSFISFYYSLRFYRLGKEVTYDQKFTDVIYTLIYTFNPYTFYLFYYIWGYSAFAFLYVLIPMLFGGIYRYLKVPKFDYKLFGILGIVFFLSNIANGNLPFFIYLNLSLIVFITFFLAVGPDRIRTLKRAFLLYVLNGFAVFYTVVPQVSEMFGLIRRFSTSAANSDLRAWIFWQTVPVSEVIFLTNYLEQYLSQISPLVFLYISFFAFFCFANLRAFTWKSRRNKEIFIAYFGLLIFCLFFINKGRGIIAEPTVWAIFKNPLFSAVRSYDKVLIFFPFIFLILVYIKHLDEKARYFWVPYVLLGLSCLSIYPMFMGNLQTEYSLSFNTRQGESYKKGKFKYIHEIPEDYYAAAAIVNRDVTDYKVLRTPYSVINSIGWVNFTKWNLVGVDPSVQLFTNNTINMNSFEPFNTWNFGALWNADSVEDSRWLLNLMGLLNTKYFVYHKDVAERFVNATVDKIQSYIEELDLEPLYKGNYIELYRVSDAYYLPHIYIPRTSAYVDSYTESLTEALSYPDFNKRTNYYISREETSSFFLDAADYYASTGSLVRFDSAWQSGWRWPECNIRPGSLVYNIALIKEKSVLAMSTDELDRIERLMWLGAKKSCELDRYNLTRDASEKVAGLMYSYYNEANILLEDLAKSGREDIDGKKYWEIIIKLRAYLEKSSSEMGLGGAQISNLKQLSDSYSRKVQKAVLPCEQEYCYTFRIGPDGDYDLYVKTAYNEWWRQKVVDLNDSFSLVSAQGVLDTSYTIENVTEEQFGKLISVKTLKPGQEYEISFDYKTKVASFGLRVFQGYPGVGETPDELVELLTLPITVRSDSTYSNKFVSSPGAVGGYLYFEFSPGYVPGQNIEISNIKIRSLSDSDTFIVKKLRENLRNIPKMEFFRINPTKYEVKISGATEPYFIVFSELFNPGWKLYLSDTSVYEPRLQIAEYFNGDIIERGHSNLFFHKGLVQNWFKKPIADESHIETNGFGNTWFIEPSDTGGLTDYVLTIEFWPQRLYYISLIISLITLGVSSGLYIFFATKEKKW